MLNFILKYICSYLLKVKNVQFLLVPARQHFSPLFRIERVPKTSIQSNVQD